MSSGLPSDEAIGRLITEETDEVQGSGSKTKGPLVTIHFLSFSPAMTSARASADAVTWTQTR